MTARKIQVADLFCGAGGSSTGAEQAIESDLGRVMDLVCANSWDRAIETHQRMHPRARHYCKQVQAIRPREAVPGGKLDLLMASPTCTHHSRARGGRPTSDQQRMDPWAVCTWATELKVDRILIENVPEYLKWGPVALSTGKPIRSQEGAYHDDWVASFDRRGYDYSYKVLNCADYGDHTTRVRYFGQFRRRDLGGAIRWPHPTHAKEPSHDLLAPRQRWRSARECIDWSYKGKSIYGRPKELSPKTLLRIYAGIVKFGWPRRYIVRLEAYLAERGIGIPIVKRASRHRGAFVFAQGSNGAPRSPEEPLPAITTINRTQLVEPFVSVMRNNASPAAIDDPLSTITAGGGHHMLVEPFVLAQGEGSEGRQVSQPLPTIPTGGAHALIAPYYGGGSGLTAKSVDEPLPTATALARFGLIVPVTHGGGNRARDIASPLPTLTCAHRGELAFITSAFGERDGQMPRTHDIDDPTPAICAQGYVPLVDAGDDDDILYRMLQPPELAAATSFPADYAFAGNKTEVTRQIGNAVPIRMARALVRSALWDLAA